MWLGQSSAELKGWGETDGILTRFEVQEFGWHCPGLERWLKDVKLTKWNRQEHRFDLPSCLQSGLKPNTSHIEPFGTFLKKLNFLCLASGTFCKLLPQPGRYTIALPPPPLPRTQESLFMENLPWSMLHTQDWIRHSSPCTSMAPNEIPPEYWNYISHRVSTLFLINKVLSSKEILLRTQRKRAGALRKWRQEKEGDPRPYLLGLIAHPRGLLWEISRERLKVSENAFKIPSI